MNKCSKIDLWGGRALVVVFLIGLWFLREANVWFYVWIACMLACFAVSVYGRVKEMIGKKDGQSTDGTDSTP